MRPRRERRGELSPLSPDQGRWGKLQCGHGASAVENHRSYRRRCSRALALQCGHGASAVENAPAGPPGACGRFGFNAATARAPWRTWQSFVAHRRRPIRFNAATARAPWRTGMVCRGAEVAGSLQCGHGASAVENAQPDALSYDPALLQCGHGASAVENVAEAGPLLALVEIPASMRPRRERRGERIVASLLGCAW